MPKPEWGTKRTCLSCGARFYDFARQPAVCPACGAVFDLEALARARRPARPPSRASSAAAVAAPVPGLDDDEEALGAGGRARVVADGEAEDDVDEAVEADEEEEVVEAEEGGDEDEEGLIEDAAELGEDDDVSDVIEGDVDEEDAR